ncbi:MAG TPA: hypothetical protein VJV23_13225 [Candidatus Polarisedimenticolia bacterium]|nr:hypothetical protein [Candidatus Polarisedimenticolia bacterium]
MTTPTNRPRDRRAARRAAAALAFALAAAAPAGSSPQEMMTEQAAAAAARELMPAVEELRGLAFSRPVPVRMVDDAVARAHFQKRLARFWPEKLLRAEQDVHVDLGLLPQGMDLEASVFSLLEEQAGGYYDPDTDTFYVLDDMPRSIAPVLIVHELTHALDDQHFALDAFFEKAMDDTDRSAVAGAVVEGSGSLVMTAFLLREVKAGRLSLDILKELARSEAGRAEKLKAAPPVLQRSLLAPYVLGQTLALRGNPMGLVQGVSPADLDRLFRDPPLSTEQLLHPEKYWDPAQADPPRPVALSDQSALLGEGWSLAADGSLGELTVALLCGASTPAFDSAEVSQPARWTNDCAAGWGGDRWQLYRGGGGRVTLLASRWDSERDAEEFASGTRGLPEGASIRRQGTTVVVAAGSPSPARDALAAAALRSLEPPAPVPSAPRQ